MNVKLRKYLMKVLKGGLVPPNYLRVKREGIFYQKEKTDERLGKFSVYPYIPCKE